MPIFRRTRSPNRLVWPEGWPPPGAQSAFIKWTGWTLAMTMWWWQHHKHCRSYYYYYYYYHKNQHYHYYYQHYYCCSIRLEGNVDLLVRSCPEPRPRMWPKLQYMYLTQVNWITAAYTHNRRYSYYDCWSQLRSGSVSTQLSHLRRILKGRHLTG